MKDREWPVGTCFLSIVEHRGVKAYMKSHLGDLLAYLDDHGLRVLAHDQTAHPDRLVTVLAIPQQEGNMTYYATRTYLDDRGLDRSACSIETSATYQA